MLREIQRSEIREERVIHQIVLDGYEHRRERRASRHQRRRRRRATGLRWSVGIVAEGRRGWMVAQRGKIERVGKDAQRRLADVLPAGEVDDIGGAEHWCVAPCVASQTDGRGERKGGDLFPAAT